MILVIADDFTGAAEMAGICLGYGLTVNLCLEEPVPGDADVLILSTDSRSLGKADALDIVKKITEAGLRLHPEWLYKKIDSVLRGYVAEELALQMELSGVRKALVLPANPSLGRTIKDGQYFVNGVIITQTGFARDPEFAITSPHVGEMLGQPARILSKEEPLQSGFNIGAAEELTDVDYWAGVVDKTCLAAGSGDFFEALLRRSHTAKSREKEPAPQKPHLFVSGTSFKKSVDLLKNSGGEYVAYLSADVIRDKKQVPLWLATAQAIIEKQGQLIIAFDETVDQETFDPSWLRLVMAAFVKEAITHFGIKELLIEGGATAAAIFRELNISCFEPLFEWNRGVVQMKGGDLLISVKPGSYELPEPVKHQYGLQKFT